MLSMGDGSSWLRVLHEAPRAVISTFLLLHTQADYEREGAMIGVVIGVAWGISLGQFKLKRASGVM